MLERLKAAGLGSLPGGGGEILVDRVREAITRGKVLTDDWLNVNRVWHELGGRSTATMMFGHVETLAERIEHLGAAAPTARRNRRLHRLHLLDVSAGTYRHGRRAAGRLVRISQNAGRRRLYLDNFPNIQSSWVTQGLKIGQLALLFGANDMGSLMIEENVVAEAGTVHYLTLDEIRAAIEELGYMPRQRNVFYQLFDENREQTAVIANRKRQKQIRAAAQLVSPGPKSTGEISNENLPIVPLSIVSGDGTA